MGGHLARMDNSAINFLIGSQAEPFEYNPTVSDVLWIDYTDAYKEGTWLDYRNNTHGFDGFDETITDYNLTDNLMLNMETQNCAVINFIRVGVWNDEWCSARLGPQIDLII